MEILQQTEYQLLKKHNQTLRNAIQELQIKLEQSKFAAVEPEEERSNEHILLRYQIVAGYKQIAQLKGLAQMLSEQNSELRYRLEQESNSKVLYTYRAAFRLREKVFLDELARINRKYEILREMYISKCLPGDDFLAMLEENQRTITQLKDEDMREEYIAPQATTRAIDEPYHEESHEAEEQASTQDNQFVYEEDNKNNSINEHAEEDAEEAENLEERYETVYAAELGSKEEQQEDDNIYLDHTYDENELF